MPNLWYIGYGIFFGTREVAKDKKRQELKITHTCTLGKMNATKAKRDNSDPNHLVIDIEDKAHAAWDTVFKNQDTIAFFERYFDDPDKEHRLFVHCKGGLVRSPFAVRCILIMFCNFTPFMARIKVWDSGAIDTMFYLTMIPVELALCAHKDRKYDFGLRLHEHAERISEDYSEHFKDKWLAVPIYPDDPPESERLLMFVIQEDVNVVALWKKVVPVSEQFKGVKEDMYPALEVRDQ